MPIAGPTRPGRNLLVALTITAALTLTVGCQSIRDFLIPPETNEAAATRRAIARYASLIVDGVQIDGRRQAVAMRNGAIAGVGSLPELREIRGPTTRLIDGRNAHAGAGLVDGHVRLDAAALRRDAIDMRQVTDQAALRQRLKVRSEQLRGDDWAWGWGLRGSLLDGLSADDLARLAPGLPILLSTADGRKALLSRSLLSALPPRLQGPARKHRGRLAGGLLRSVWRTLPAPRSGRLKPLLVQTLSGLRDRGITTIHIMGATADIWRILVDLERDRRLDVRCVIYLDALHPSTGRALATRKRERAPKREAGGLAPGAWRSRLVTLAGLELWLEPGGASADAAALDRALAERLRQADDAGLQLAVHLEGDDAAKRVSRVLRAARRSPGAPPLRIERPSDVATVLPLCRQRAIASIQPPSDRASWLTVGLARECTVVVGSALPAGSSRPWRFFTSLTSVISPARAMARMSADHRGHARRLAVGAPADIVLWNRAWEAGGKAPVPTLVIVDGVIVHDVRFHAAEMGRELDEPVAPLPQKATPPGV